MLLGSLETKVLLITEEYCSFLFKTHYLICSADASFFPPALVTAVLNKLSASSDHYKESILMSYGHTRMHWFQHPQVGTFHPSRGLNPESISQGRHYCAIPMNHWFSLPDVLKKC